MATTSFDFCFPTSNFFYSVQLCHHLLLNFSLSCSCYFSSLSTSDLSFDVLLFGSEFPQKNREILVNAHFLSHDDSWGEGEEKKKKSGRRLLCEILEQLGRRRWVGDWSDVRRGWGGTEAFAHFSWIFFCGCFYRGWRGKYFVLSERNSKSRLQ